MENKPEETIKFYTDPDKEPEVYHVVGDRNPTEGSKGKVFHIKDDQENHFALKQCTMEDKELFIESARDTIGNQLPHYVPVERMGFVDQNLETPALLMGYGGTDLKKVYTHIKDVPFPKYIGEKPEVVPIDLHAVQAFGYKVMLTLVDALKKGLEEKNRTHGDLFPQNILCGLDFWESKADAETLESRLILGEVTLCDPAMDDQLSRLSQSGSKIGAKLDFNNYFVDASSERRTQEADAYATLAVWAWMETGRNVPVHNFVKKKLDFEMEYDDNTGKRILPDLTLVSEKIKLEIKDSEYFILSELELEDHVKKEMRRYTAVLRPIDKLIADWDIEWKNKLAPATKKDSDPLLEQGYSSEVEKFFQHHENSYLNLLKRVESRQNTGTEKSRMQKKFQEYVVSIAEHLSTQIDKKAERRTRLEQEINETGQNKGLDYEIKELEGKIADKDQEKNQALQAVKNLQEKWYEKIEQGDPSAESSLFEQKEKAECQVRQKMEERKSLEKLLKPKKTRREAIDIEYQRWDYDDEKKAMGYLSQKCLPLFVNLGDNADLKPKVEEMLKKQGI